MDTLLTAIQDFACTTVRDQLVSLGATMTDREEEYVLLVDAVEQQDHVALSLLLGHAVPDAVLQVSAEAEVMFANVPTEKRAAFSRDGKWVRELVSKDFVRQFVMPITSRLVVTRKEDMRGTLINTIDGLYDKWFRPAGR
jgi:hypothetical protein